VCFRSSETEGLSHAARRGQGVKYRVNDEYEGSRRFLVQSQLASLEGG